MRLAITLGELKKIIRGRLIKGTDSTPIDSFSTDTRTMSEGDIFWALKGKTLDGNKYIAQAVEKGAAGVICRKGAVKTKELWRLSFCIEVQDTLAALHSLAMFHRMGFTGPVISVTGSNGKTTSKEMIRAVLATKSPVCSNLGNFNNEFGLPFSILELEKRHRSAVFELGASRPGDILQLANIARPDIAVITTIGAEHLEFFKSMENIFITETEVLRRLKKPNSPVIYNGDNEYLKRLRNRKLNLISFGFEKQNELVVKEHNGNFSFVFGGKGIPIKLIMPGRHNYLNAAAAFLAGLTAGVDQDRAIRALEQFEGVPMRMQKISIKKAEVFFDAYNANPQSMETALEEVSRQGVRYFLILGDMKELGRYSRGYHLELGKKIAALSPTGVVLVGQEIRITYDFLKSRKENVKYFTNTDAATEEVRALLSREKATFLFKASRAMRFERLLPTR